ncbi:MAG: HEPN domain-containing protein [Phycisphaerae bacterium]|nr:HEPN domain-containing protein [Phycisphaerae bacterium]
MAIARYSKPADAYWEDLAFHAQQAAELALKAVHQHVGRTYRFTHNIEELVRGLAEAGLSIPAVAKDAVILTRYAVWTRYPGLSPLVTKEEYEEAVGLAQAIVNWAREIVGKVETP